jgi:hypothetical protein
VSKPEAVASIIKAPRSPDARKNKLELCHDSFGLSELLRWPNLITGASQPMASADARRRNSEG